MFYTLYPEQFRNRAAVFLLFNLLLLVVLLYRIALCSLDISVATLEIFHIHGESGFLSA